MIVLRITSFIGIVLCALFFPFWFFVVGAFLYAVFFSPYEILFLGICIDAEFGDRETTIWFLYTVSALVILVISNTVRPYLSFYKS